MCNRIEGENRPRNEEMQMVEQGVSPSEFLSWLPAASLCVLAGDPNDMRTCEWKNDGTVRSDVGMRTKEHVDMN